jgi:hypothetical protein
MAKATNNKRQTRQAMRNSKTNKTNINTTRSSHRNRVKNNESRHQSTDTDTSCCIDEHRTRESAKDRTKEAREQAMRSGLKTQTNTLTTAKQPYVWGDEDDSTEDEEVELQRLIETRTCITEAIRRSKLIQAQVEQEPRDRQNVANAKNREEMQH